MVNKRYYKKKGPSFRERLRCPLCGKISPIGYFSQDHQFGIYRWRYGGKGNITVNRITKSIDFMKYLTSGLVDRFLELLEKFAGCKYYSQYQVDDIIDKYEQQLFAEHGARIVPAVVVPITAPVTAPVKAPIMSKIIIPNEVIY